MGAYQTAKFAVEGFSEVLANEYEFDYRTTFDVNLFGAIEIIRLILPDIRRQQRGTIVNVPSLRGIVSVGGKG
jgi:NAD(P)-dependent dehydrogenase (short-subunit alcohol dehydrogenase family)